jgi:hypothetical protein
MNNNIDNVKIEIAGKNVKSPEFKKMVKLWIRDYQSSGDICADFNNLYSSILKNCSETTLIAMHDGIMVGFVIVLDDNKSKIITISYTLNRYRGAGIATMMYLHAINHLNADTIEVSSWRAKSKVEYWKKLGFKSFKKRIDQGYSNKSLCHLSLNDRCHSIMAFPLERDEIFKFLRSQGSSIIDNLSIHFSHQKSNTLKNISLTDFHNSNCTPRMADLYHFR